MKKHLFTILLCLLTGASIYAQSGKAFNKRDKLLNAGVGLNSYYTNGLPVGASVEFGISDIISVGGNFDYLSSTYNYGLGYKNKFAALYFGARAAYHFNELLQLKNEKIDLYGGATIGFRNFSFNNNFSNSGLGNKYSSDLFLGGFIGGRYYTGSHFGFFAELGAIGSTNARAGISYKF